MTPRSSPLVNKRYKLLRRSLTPVGEDFQGSTVGSRAWACEPHCKSLFLLQTMGLAASSSAQDTSCMSLSSHVQRHFLPKLVLSI